ncbi:unnamed protein product, partial [Cladocopium goreaui]
TETTTESGGEETSSSEDAPSEEEKPKVGQVSLTVSRLEAMHSLASLGDDEMSTFAQQGVDMQRIRHPMCKEAWLRFLGPAPRPAVKRASIKGFFMHLYWSAAECDITLHLKYTDELLAHYTSQWRDREVYWMCRQRSRSVKDILCCIIDSYDKAKICLPSFPQKRTPKAQVYETIRRTWTHDSFVLRLCLHILCHLFSLCFLTVPPPSRLT